METEEPETRITIRHLDSGKNCLLGEINVTAPALLTAGTLAATVYFGSKADHRDQVRFDQEQADREAAEELPSQVKDESPAPEEWPFPPRYPDPS